MARTLAHPISVVAGPIVLSVACGGLSVAPAPSPEPDSSLSALDAGVDVKLRPYVPPYDAAPVQDTGTLPVYREDACPYVPLPDPQIECDPIAQNQCPPGYACYPTPPHGVDPCHPGPYTIECIEEGTGSQGSPCGDGVRECKAGYVCAVTGQGDQCIKLCRPGAIGACTDGMVCERLDIPGYGGCL